jgi:HD-like signal output (HDOD) protein
VEQAIISVLGLRLTINISIGIALGRQFRKSNAGPMGLHDYWRHSIFHALLMQGLSSRIPNHLAIHPDLSYLCGLLHDFGILVIGHINRRKSILLNEMIKANGESDRIVLENQILGYSHSNMGAALLQRWKIHPAVVAVAANHHELDDQGPYNAYVRLARVCDFALEYFEFGSTEHAKKNIPPDNYEQTLEQLALDQQDVQDLCTHLEIMKSELESMADVLIG